MKKKTCILVTGANGQLGSEFLARFSAEKQYQVKSFNSNELDITDFSALHDAVTELKPDLFINCAAYTKVDVAENDSEKCYQVNEIGVKHLGELCALNKALLLHFSTDYVFDGETNMAYSETDICNPINVYGASKLAGEKSLEMTECNYMVLRLSWLYSEFGMNFPKTIQKLLTEREEIKVVNDQVSSPTWTKPLVNFLVDKVISEPAFFNRSVNHWTEDGEASWFEIAKEINQTHQKKVVPVSSEFFNSAATRPKYSKLSSQLVNEFKSYNIPWQDNLSQFLRRSK